MPLETLLKQQIKHSGPMNVSTFMELVLSHPQYGYYMTRDPFGVSGDFTTAPEISQMFGEMIGVFLADTWMKMGAPERFTLAECGPGRGTLMADIMRSTRGVIGFHAACQICFLEVSPVLRKAQAAALLAYNPVWVDTLDEVSTEAPVLVLGNEFLDALPIHQFIGEQERCITHDAQQGFVFTHPPVSVVERSPARESFMSQVSVMLKRSGGAGLFIDYGYESGTGDTLQAVHTHKPCHVLEHIGEADITAHVDFGAFRQCVPSQITTQGAFLKALGIDARAQALSQISGGEDIQAALHRLTHDDEMGTLFKVMGVTHDQTLNLAGF